MAVIAIIISDAKDGAHVHCAMEPDLPTVIGATLTPAQELGAVAIAALRQQIQKRQEELSKVKPLIAGVNGVKRGN